MKRFAPIFFFGSLAVASALGAPPSAADLFRRPEISRAHLSPDGKHVLLVGNDERGSLWLFDTATGTRQPLKFTLGVSASPMAPFSIQDVRWLGPTRLLLRTNFTRLPPDFGIGPALMSTPPGARIVAGPGGLPSSRQIESYSGFSAIDITGKEPVNLPGIAMRSDSLPGANVPPFTWDARRVFVPAGESGILFAPANDGTPGPHPDLARLDTRKGTASRVVANPGSITEWLPDATGRAVIGIDGSGATTKLLTREAGGDKWIELADLGEPRKRLRLGHWDPKRALIYAGRLGPEGRTSLSAFDLRKKTWLPPFLQHGRYDAVQLENRDAYGLSSLELSQILFSPKTGLPLAVELVTDIARQNCLDPRLKEIQSRLQSAGEGLVARIIEIDDAETTVLTMTRSPRQPGYYSVVDLATNKITRVDDSMPWLDPNELAEQLPVKFKARDGTELDAYVTLPPRRGLKQLPLVLLVREQPWQRDAWGLLSFGQFLATRGYAVLQVNHRGSSGYGEAFLAAGREGLGTLVQDDLVDAVRWAIAQGLADPKRVGVVGTGFGGYCALMALGRDADIFRCGVAINAVTNWRDILHDKDTPAYRYWFGTSGLSPSQPKEKWDEISPITLAARFQSPLLLVQSEADFRSSTRSARAFAAALKKSGHAPETFFYDVDRTDRNSIEKKQLETYDRLAAFLARTLPVDEPLPPAGGKE